MFELLISLFNELENHQKVYIDINGKQSIKVLEKGCSINFNKYNRQIKAWFMIYADFESILTKIESKEHKADYTATYQDHIACSYEYNLVCADDTLSKPEKDYLGKDSVYNFISNMIEEEYCKEIMKKEF